MTDVEDYIMTLFALIIEFRDCGIQSHIDLN